MKNSYFSLAICLLASCATISNSNYSTTRVVTYKKPATLIIDSDTINFSGANKFEEIKLQRSKEIKVITIIRDTSIHTMELRPKWSPAQMMNIATYGIGFIVDHKTPKKWGYPSTIYLSDTGGSVYKNRSYSHKGVVNLRFSIPEVNWLNFDVQDYGRKSGFGFLGLSLGLDYYYKDNRFFNITGSVVLQSELLFPARIHYTRGTKEYMNDVFIALSNNHKINRFSFGYGFSYGRTRWFINYYGAFQPDLTQEISSVQKDANSLGFVFPVYFYTKRSFYAGIVYRPTFMQFSDKTKFNYQHSLSLDLGWRIRLAK